MSGIVWRPEDDPKIRPPLHKGKVYRPDILDGIETSIDGLSGELRALSLDIHGNAAIGPSFLYQPSSHIFGRPPRAKVRRKVRWIYV